MQLARQKIHTLIESMPDSQLDEVAEFILFIKSKGEKEYFKDFEKLSNSSTDFWYNEIDDDVWNDV